MGKRNAGFYFVQHPAHDGWLTAMVDDNGQFSIPGYGKYLDESCFEIIGDRIPTPDEPWQCVPLKITDEMENILWESIAPQREWEYALAVAPKP